MKKQILPLLLSAMTISQLLFGQAVSIEVTPLGGSASDQYANNPGGETPDMAFDQNPNTKWLTFTSPSWIQFLSKKSVLLSKYAITSANDSPERDPQSWTLQGSRDGVTWTTLDTRSNITFSARFQRQEFTIPTPGTTLFSYFRLNPTIASGSGLTQIAEIELYASSGNAIKGGPPVAEFGTAKPWLSAGQSTTFVDYSQNNPTSWEWTFPGGTPSTSTAQNPQVTYSTAGNYAVTLKVTNADGSNTVSVANKILVKSVADNNWTNFHYPAIKIIDYNDAGTTGQQIMHTAFPNLADTLKQITLLVNKGLYNNIQEGFQYDSLIVGLQYADGVAWAGGSRDKHEITVSTKWLVDLYNSKNGNYNAIRLELKGMFIHEITHTYQPGPEGAGNYGSRNDNSAFIEGDADYIRQISLEEGRTPNLGGSYLDGYSTTAFFMMYLGKTYYANNQDNFSYAFNSAILGLNPKWSFDKALKLLFGKSLTTLWNEYQVSLGVSPSLKPLTNFEASPTIVAVNQPVKFTNQTGNAVQSYSWAFSGGTPSSSTATNPTSVTYSSAGSYNVSLTATNASGSQVATKSNYITVVNKTGELYDITDYLGNLTTDAPTQISNGNELPKIIDNDKNSKYYLLRNSGWVQWRSVASYEPVAYSVTSSDSAIYDPTSWTLSASTDGTNWTTIHTVSGFSFTDRSQTQSFTVTNQNGLKYAYFKLQLSNTNSTKIKVAEWEIFGLLLPAGVNQKPVVAITSPVNSSTFTSPASITIVASASDYDGTITKVNFYAGSTRLFVDNSSPYTYTWTGVTSGSYTLKAVAYDNSGDSTASTLVLTTVNPPSTCTAQIWNATTAYNGGAVVQYNGIKYTANWWTQGDQPDTHSGPSGSGQPWINNGTCTSRQEQVTLASSVSLVPNPVENTATVQITAENNQYLSIYVVDIYGNKVLDVFNGEITDGTQSIPLYASSLSSGIYLLKTESNGNATFIRFIKN